MLKKIILEGVRKILETQGFLGGATVLAPLNRLVLAMLAALRVSPVPLARY